MTSRENVRESLKSMLLETMIAKNNVFFLVMDEAGTIVYQNIPNGEGLHTLDDLGYLLRQPTIEKIRTYMKLSPDDVFEITLQEGLLEFILFTQPQVPHSFFLQIKIPSGSGEHTSLPEDGAEGEAGSAQAEREILDMQEVQSLLLELKELEMVDETEDTRRRVKEHFLPALVKQQKQVKDPLVLICLDIIHRNLDEYVDSSGTMTKLYSVLTPSEVKVADFIRMGMSSKDIANTLEITEKTVENHRNKLREKLGIKNKGVNLQVFLMGLDQRDGKQ